MSIIEGFDKFYSVADVAEALNVADATVRVWIKSGALPAVKLGKGYSIRHQDLQRFIAAKFGVSNDGTT